MALDERKLLELMINKFNEEYHASHQYDNFLIYPIPPNTDYTYGYEAKGAIYNIDIKFRAYFNIHNQYSLSKFRFVAIDDDVPGEDYTFVTIGIIHKDMITTDGTFNQVIDYDGSGMIDPTNVCTNVSMVLGSDEW
jgi:hypothetical protein